MAKRTINRFFRPTAAQYTSQFVDERIPFGEMMAVGQAKQQAYDDALAALYDLEDRLSIQYAPHRQKEAQNYLRGFEERIQPLVDKILTTGDTQEAVRKLGQLNKEWLKSPQRRNIEEEYSAYQAYLDSLRKMTKGYAPQNDPYLLYEKLYKDKGYPEYFGFEGMRTYEDPYKHFENLLNNMQAQGSDYFMSLDKKRMAEQLGVDEEGQNITNRNIFEQFLQTPHGLQMQTDVVMGGKDLEQEYLLYANKAMNEFERLKTKVPEAELPEEEDERQKMYSGWGIGSGISAVVTREENVPIRVRNITDPLYGEYKVPYKIKLDKKGKPITDKDGEPIAELDEAGNLIPLESEDIELMFDYVFYIGGGGKMGGAEGKAIEMTITPKDAWSVNNIYEKIEGVENADFELDFVGPTNVFAENIDVDNDGDIDYYAGQMVPPEMKQYQGDYKTEKKFFAKGRLYPDKDNEETVFIPYEQLKGRIKTRTGEGGEGGFYIDEDKFFGRDQRNFPGW